jgi:hypothetical protein
LVGTTKVYSGVGADIVVESITLTTRIFADRKFAAERRKTIVWWA